MTTPTPIGPQDIQGNILKGHGRDFTGLVFFRFAGRADAALQNRRLLREAALGTVPQIAITSAGTQQKQSGLYKEKAAHYVDTGFRSLGLTAFGLAACGYTAQNLGLTGKLGSDPFWDGADPTLIGDAGNWDPAFAFRPDGVFLLAHDDQDSRDTMAEETVALLREAYGVAEVVIEKGFRWTPYAEQQDATAYEPFGFADGFARTNLIADPASPLRHLVGPSKELIKQKVEPFELPLEQVMIEEPGTFLGGSFLVVHKLEQNVRAFLQAEEHLEKNLGTLPSGMVRRPGAVLIGRESNGTPLVYGATKPTDRFHFGGDPNGSRCPFSAHIRKMNPRQNAFRGVPHEQSDRAMQKAALVLRRGCVFGDSARLKPKWERPIEAPDGGVGLLFMAYMSKIGAQFLMLLLNWATHENFPQEGSGADSLLAAGGKPWDWAQHPDLANPKPMNLGNFVTSKGAAFFVVPPLHWLRTVA